MPINTQRGRHYLVCKEPSRNNQAGAVRQQRFALALDDALTNGKVAEQQHADQLAL
jgi:hypothetical protein